MSLHFFNETPLTIGTQIDPVDVGTGDGVTTTYQLTQKTALHMGVTIQADAFQYYQFNGGFTKNTSNDTVTLSSPAPNGSNIVFPGLSQLVAQAFDQDVVPGVINPRVVEVPFWMGDFNEIHLNRYENTPNNPGIRIGLVNLVPAAGAQLAWCQLTCSDVNGAALGYLPTGTDLYTPNISAFSTLSVSGGAGASSCTVADASEFIAGDYVILNIGFVTQEIVQITSINYGTNTLTTTPWNFNHYIGESVFTCARKFWLKVTIPLNATNNTALNFYNIAPVRQGKVRARP